MLPDSNDAPAQNRLHRSRQRAGPVRVEQLAHLRTHRWLGATLRSLVAGVGKVQAVEAARRVGAQCDVDGAIGADELVAIEAGGDGEAFLR